MLNRVLRAWVTLKVEYGERKVDQRKISKVQELLYLEVDHSQGLLEITLGN